MSDFVIKNGVLEKYIGSDEIIVIPDGVTSIGERAFKGCKSLTDITIPDSVTSIGVGALDRCTNLKYTEFDDAFYLGNDKNPYFALIKSTTLTINKCIIHTNTKIIGSGAFQKCQSLTDVVIPEGLISIGDKAFEGCVSLKSVIIPKSVTTLGMLSFRKCTSLSSVTMFEGITKIEYCAFDDCTALLNITIPDSVTIIEDYAFKGCSSLERINIPEGVISIKDGFNGCINLKCTELDGAFYLGNEKNPYHSLMRYAGKKEDEFVVPESTKIIYSGALRGCTTIAGITIPYGVTEIGTGAFQGCTSLASINIPDSVMFIGERAFSECTSLKRAVISRSISTIIYNMFSGCESLSDVVIPEGVTNIHSYAFCGCKSLSDIVIPKSVKEIGNNAFEGCESLSDITIPDGVTIVGDMAFSKCNSLKSLIIPPSVHSLGFCAFSSCKSIESVTLFNVYKGDEEGQFFGCTNLARIKIIADCSSLDVEEWKRIFDVDVLPVIAFDNLDKNASFTKYILRDKVGVFNTLVSKGRIDLIYKFLEYSNKISLDVLDKLIEISINEKSSEATAILVEYKNEKFPPNVISEIERDKLEKKIGIREYTISDWREIFEFEIENESAKITGYIGMESIVNIPRKIENYFVTSIGSRAFYGNDFVNSITLPEGITSIERDAFECCTLLSSIVLPDSVTSIESGAFRECTSLLDIVIPKSVTDIESWVFQSCSSLSTVTISDGVTNIELWAFDGCLSLTSVIIPDSVKSIGDTAFDCCDSLVIKGKKGSAAEKFAKKKNIQFEEI